MINGNTLIELGFKPAKWFKEALESIEQNNIQYEDVYSYVQRFIPEPIIFIEPLTVPMSYSKNIECTNEVEEFNFLSVVTAMDEVMKTPTVVGGAIMPDACPVGGGAHIPVGGVAITKNAIHPAMHSADICCSVMITGFGNIKPEVILDHIHKITDFGAGPRKNKHKMRFELPKELYKRMESNKFFDKKALSFAKSHLGTQGDGNHFAFVGSSKNTNETCLVTHHGSRGLGARVFKLGMELAERYRKMISPNTNKINAWIPYDTEDGVEYWEALQLVREWTKLNHEVLHFWIREKVKYTSKLHFWNEHNFVFKKDDLFYHAKGATPLLNEFVPDNETGLRLIPLNMSQPILVVRGTETENNIGFAPHGAGRNMSRTEHKRSLNLSVQEQLELETKGLDVRFYSGNADVSELPSAYKNAEEVKRQITHFGLGEIVDEILPYGCIMAGESVRR